MLIVKDFESAAVALHPILRETLKAARKSKRNPNSRGEYPNIAIGDFVLMARGDLTVGEKLSLCLHGPWCVITALSDYIFQVENPWTWLVDDVHGSRLKFYHVSTLETIPIWPHAVQPETGKPVQRLKH